MPHPHYKLPSVTLSCQNCESPRDTDPPSAAWIDEGNLLESLQSVKQVIGGAKKAGTRLTTSQRGRLAWQSALTEGHPTGANTSHCDPPPRCSRSERGVTDCCVRLESSGRRMLRLSWLSGGQEVRACGACSRTGGSGVA